MRLNSFTIYKVSSGPARRAGLLQEPSFHPTPMVVPEASGYVAPLGSPRTVHQVNAILPKPIPVSDVANIIGKEHRDHLRQLWVFS